jgi:hypothetical protein
MLFTQQKCAENTFIMEVSTNPVKQQKVVDLFTTVLLNSWNFSCYCMQLILGNVFIFISTPFPVAGSVTITAWMWNITIYTADPK